MIGVGGVMANSEGTRRVGIAICILSAAMFGGAFGNAQTSSEVPPAGSAPAATENKPLQAGATILSDTMGVDFSGYISRLHNDIQHNWEPLIPKEVQSPLLKKGAVGIRFTILPDGTIGSMKLETSSRDVELDKAAWYAITSEGKFPALPAAFHGPQLELRIGFFYNAPPPPGAPQ
jgi:TonB family protein